MREGFKNLIIRSSLNIPISNLRDNINVYSVDSASIVGREDCVLGA